MYYYYNCSFEQVITPTVTQAAVNWRNDVLLETPQLVYPQDDAVLCLESAGVTTGIVVEWDAVAGATHYLLQWGNNPQLSTPSFREEMITAPTVSYEFDADQISLGETVYWRVIAINRVTGGASAKSEVRKLTYNCGDQSVSEDILDLCTFFDVQLKINGIEYASCCDEGTYWLEISHKCKDQFGNVLVEIAGIAWEVETDPSSNGSANIKQKLEGGKKIILETCGDVSQVFKLRAFVLFNDYVNGGEFECQVEKLIFMDCDTPFHTRPWSGNQVNCNSVCLHHNYSDQYAWGLLYNPCTSSGESSCEGVCLTHFGEGTETVVVDGVTIYAELDFTSVCPGETITISGTVQYTAGPFPPDVITTTLTPFGCGAPAGDSINTTTTPEPFSFVFSYPATSCVCLFGINIDVNGSTSSIFFEFTGDPETSTTESECRLNSYENIVVATGPVFKIPISCGSGIYTECCECTPESIGFYVDSGGYQSTGRLIYNAATGQWESNDRHPAFGASEFLGPSFLYCANDYWHFETAFGNDGCRETDSCPCVPSPLTVDGLWTLDDGTQGTFSIDTEWELYQNWIWRGSLKFTPNDCSDIFGHPIIIERLILSFDLMEAFIDLSDEGDTDWSLVDNTPAITITDCDPFTGFVNFVFTHPLCENIEILFTWEVPACEPCGPSGWLLGVFNACDPFYAELSLSDPSFPNPIDFVLGVDGGCGCGSSATGGAYALEARVNIPLSCHFKVVNGQLALNLDNLLGPGLFLGVNPETGCEYIGSYGGYGGDPVIYREVYIYCCYSVYNYMASSESLSAVIIDAFSVDDPELPELETGTPITPIPLVAHNGTEPYTFEVISGSLPDGLSISGDEIVGTPTTVETAEFRIVAYDALLQEAYTSSLSWNIIAP